MIREDIKIGLGKAMPTEDVQDIVKIIEAGQDMIPIIEVVMDIVHEVAKGMGGIIIVMIIGGVAIEIKIMIETGVGHMKDRIGTKEIVEV